MGKWVIGAAMVVCLGGGWLAGSVWPAPAPVLAALDKGGVQRVKAGLAGLDLEKAGGDLFTADQWRSLSKRAVTEQAAQGRVIAVERLDAKDVAEAAATAATESEPAPAKAAGPTNDGLPSGGVCPRMTVSNAPSAAALAQLQAKQTKAVAVVQGVTLSLLPAPGACVSSGFGQRNGRLHKGVDYHARTGVPVYASGDGVVRELKWRDDYGNMVVIDHGKGVFTRYAHLAGFDPGLKLGATVKAGTKLGLMGNTAAYSIPVHLHYEVLTGDYDTPKGSFGLTPVDPFAGIKKG